MSWIAPGSPSPVPMRSLLARRLKFPNSGNFPNDSRKESEALEDKAFSRRRAAISRTFLCAFFSAHESHETHEESPKSAALRHFRAILMRRCFFGTSDSRGSRASRRIGSDAAATRFYGVPRERRFFRNDRTAGGASGSGRAGIWSMIAASSQDSIGSGRWPRWRFWDWA
jgi:hypothetical protein